MAPGEAWSFPYPLVAIRHALLQRIARVYPDRLAPFRLGKVGGSALVLAIGFLRRGARPVGVGGVGSLADRLAEIRDGALEILRFDNGTGAHITVIPRDAAQIIGVGGAIGVAADHLIEIR